MRPEISEFSYGYAFTEEIIHRVNNARIEAPFFPSLIAEGRGLGFDVGFNFGIFLFIQFKLSDYLNSSAAREVKEDIRQPPYYRFELRARRHSRQHDSLLALENHGYLVYYVASAFHTLEELNDYYIDRIVADNSVYVPPSQIGEITDLQTHHISFDMTTNYGYFLSEPRGIGNVRPFEFFSREVFDSLQDRGLNGLTVNAQEDLTKRMIEILSQTNPYFDEDFRARVLNDNLRPLQNIAYLARTFFGCETFIVRPQNP